VNDRSQRRPWPLGRVPGSPGPRGQERESHRFLAPRMGARFGSVSDSFIALTALSWEARLGTKKGSLLPGPFEVELGGFELPTSWVRSCHRVPRRFRDSTECFVLQVFGKNELWSFVRARAVREAHVSDSCHFRVTRCLVLPPRALPDLP
jgi:hypothetical protein